MKKILNIILIITLLGFCASNSYSQNIFIGIWEHQKGNEIFRVIIESDPDYGESGDIFGHYEKVQINNGIETYIYASNKEKFVGNNDNWVPYVFGLSGDNGSVGGVFLDNTVNGTIYKKYKSGHLDIEIISISSDRPPIITARWKVEQKSYRGGKTDDEAPTFSVPTDIILTKANRTL